MFVLSGKLDKDGPEEVNCLYVAASRAIAELHVHQTVAEWLALAGVELEGHPMCHMPMAHPHCAYMQA